MGTFGARQRRFFQTSLLGLIFLVGLSAAAFWAWRRYTSSNRPETVADLVHLLGSGRLEERRLAARRLVMAATSQSESVIPALLLSLEDPSADVRGDAVASLGAYLASALSNRGQALLNSERDVANLDRVGEGLLDSLAKDDDADVRVSAASALALIRNKLDAVSGSETMSSRPASLAHGTLVAALDAALQRDPANRRGLMLSLGLVAHRSLAAPPGLLAVLDHPDAASRAQAVIALSGFGSGIDPALTVILRDLEDKQSVFRNEDDQGSDRFFTSRDYWLGIRKMHLSPAVVPRLQEALGSRDPPVARCAVILLGNIGPEARAAIPALVKALQTAGPVEPFDNLTGKSATLDIAETIAKVAPLDEAVAALTRALRSPISFDARRGRDRFRRARGQGPRRHSCPRRHSQRDCRQQRQVQERWNHRPRPCRDCCWCSRATANRSRSDLGPSRRPGIWKPHDLVLGHLRAEEVRPKSRPCDSGTPRPDLEGDRRSGPLARRDSPRGRFRAGEDRR